MKPERLNREDYAVFSNVPVSLYDIDLYGHMSNINYHKFVDNAVHVYLYEETKINLLASSHVGVIVNSNCDFFRETRWPENESVEVGIRVNRLGNSSVEYGGGVFSVGASEPSAQVRFTHVWINQATRKPEAIPADIRAAFEAILRP